MSNLQSSIIRDFRERFPNYSFRKIAKLTGLNSSRVFRVFNGHEMKVSEFEIFQEVLGTNENSAEFFKLAKTCYTDLSNKRIQSLITEMKFNLICEQ